MFPLYFFTKTLDFFNIIVYNRYVYIYLVWCTARARTRMLPPKIRGTEMKKERRYIHV